MKELAQIEKELKAPFRPDDIEWRVGSTDKEKTKGLALAYVTNRAIQNRLDEVFGIAGWRNEFKDWKGSGVLCGLSCFVNGEWLTKWDGAEETNMEATKGGLSDAMKRAGYQWGIGRYLYTLPQTWVALKNGKYLAETPKLPEWALPEGFKYPNSRPQLSTPPGDNNPNPPSVGSSEEGKEETFKCADCKVEINKPVHTFSVQHFGKPLCRTCQAKAKKAGAKSA